MSQHSKKDAPTSRSRKQQQQQQQQQNAESIKQKPNALGNSSTANRKSNGGIPWSSNAASPSGGSITTSASAPALTRKKSQTKLQKEKERAERETLVLWRRPVQTVRYCGLELVTLVHTSWKRLLQQRGLLAAVLVLGTLLSFTCYLPGPHQLVLDVVRRNTWFFIYWTGLGVLSSVGLGTGLHTFLLYLGPHIASVTLAAYECNSLNFPRPPYPDDIICPEEPYVKKMPNLWMIMSKVRMEAFLWGAGTALGELPPYFMAKAARLSGYDPDDAEELAEFEALKAKRNQTNLSLMDKGKLFMERVVERVGFLGILACASIPNPLFDLAGITCGHFLVPFWTFFGATLIGKAIIKMHIQKVFVIIAFNEALIERAVDLLGKLPIFGKKLQEPFKGFLNNQKKHLHRQRQPAAESGNLLSKVFETFVICMVCYFIISIVNSLAQNYHKRLHKKHVKKVKKSIGKD
ncbi:vacuole membrane protein 1 [Anastrepha obliqua]|uniref:vacuole membrane protein 1 n=1 Tax=Anastrepha obliqua TaxID=95512 RepID=UPI00240A07DF|nr:vacuole membrane protein 1 [Anastrepha obliqua]